MTNILFITADEMRADCAGFAGNPDVKTPHLDALAARGTVFENHFAPFPKCVPSRCALQTGRTTHTDGLRSVMKANHIGRETPTLAAFLRAQGYETAMLGLNHVWKHDDFYGKGDAENQPGAGVLDYTSFTHGPLRQLAMQPRAYPAGTERRGAGPDGLRRAGLEFQGLTQGTKKDFCDENRADQARLFLREIRDPKKPFFLQLNLSKPHPAYTIHEPWYSMFDPSEITPFPFDLPQGAPLPLRAQRQWRTGNDLPPASAREIQAVYYAMISFIDSLVGEVLAELDKKGLTENTLVIFTSDHGDYAGQFGLLEKWDASLHDCLLHVPFAVAGPGVPQGERFGGLSEHVDVADMLLDYLGMKSGAEWVRHGSSLLPALQGKAVKTAVFADGGHEAAMRARFDKPAWQEKDGCKFKTTQGKQLTYQQCPDAMARCKMVRTSDWKLVIREVGGNELYDLCADPQELVNLYGQGQHAAITSELQLQLIQWCLRTDTDRPYLAEFGA